MKLNQEIITSRKNLAIVRAASFSEKKYRDEHACFIAEGFKLFREAILSGVCIAHVYISLSAREQYLQSIADSLASEIYANTEVTIISDECFEKISSEKSPQGVITIVKYLDKVQNNIKINKETDFLSSDSKLLFLSSVRDPSNLGAILRSAAAFGTDTIVMSADCADPYNPKTVRASMGALFRLRLIRTTSLKDAVDACRMVGRRVYAAELTERAISLDDVALLRRDVIVVGNEGHGIASDVSDACEGSIYIPISKQTESLNAAVAASIFLWVQRG